MVAQTGQRLKLVKVKRINNCEELSPKWDVFKKH